MHISFLNFVFLTWLYFSANFFWKYKCQVTLIQIYPEHSFTKCLFNFQLDILSTNSFTTARSLFFCAFFKLEMSFESVYEIKMAKWTNHIENFGIQNSNSLFSNVFKISWWDPLRNFHSNSMNLWQRLQQILFQNG